MRYSRTLGGMVAIAAVLAVGGPAGARPNSYQSQAEFAAAENWNAWQTWEILDGGTYRNMTSSDPLPQAGDTVVIRSPDVIQVTDGRGVMSLTIDSGGKVEVTGGGSAQLTIAGASPVLAINQDDGVVINAGVLEFGATVTVTGSGRLKGNHANAVIQIAPGSGTVTLQNNVEFHGLFTMQEQASVSGTSNYINGNLLHADGAGAILLAASLNSVDDVSGAVVRWKASANGSASLRFNVAATGLEGYFYVETGSLYFDEDVTTTGLLSFKTNGVIQTAANDVFTFGGHSSSDCSGGAYDSPIGGVDPETVGPCGGS